MAEVFLATRVGEEQGQLCAVKRVLPEFSDDRSFVRMFLDEIQIVSRLTHPNICTPDECGQVDGVYFMSMDFIAGVSLRTLLRKGHPLPAEVPVEAIAKISAALGYAHGLQDGRGEPLGIIHRDVTPSNVMVSFEGEVKLFDFGIAKARTQAERTRTGILKGKYPYMSPEQLRGAQDQRSDLFSLGVVLFECLTGSRPFQGRDQLQVAASILECTPTPPMVLRPELDPQLVVIVLKALARRPEDRFQDGYEMQRVLEEYLATRSSYPTASRLETHIKELFPERYRQVTAVAAQARKLGENGHAPDEREAVPTRVVPSAPFEDLADDIDEEAPTRLWQGEGDGFTMTGVTRRRKKGVLLLIVAVLIGSTLGIGLGLGIWQLIRAGTTSSLSQPIVRPLNE